MSAMAHGMPLVKKMSESAHGMPLVKNVGDGPRDAASQKMSQTAHGITLVKKLSEMAHGMPLVKNILEMAHGMPLVKKYRRRLLRSRWSKDVGDGPWNAVGHTKSSTLRGNAARHQGVANNPGNGAGHKVGIPLATKLSHSLAGDGACDFRESRHGMKLGTKVSQTSPVMLLTKQLSQTHAWCAASPKGVAYARRDCR
ncbi:hypothetical protein DPMN_074378 [Dreissena polymorpha]|uniref:Uncharacterized protein n=1 Tax=Dreissena polymorpha TaxID=45954 RepID=A0A9D4BLI6_DREPO|nr:hypothetical protein DPMN_074378 [Dreissena polymorpha]